MFGVILTPVCDEQVLHMWKGYRSAQLGWFLHQSPDPQFNQVVLVIYVPKRGVVELWKVPTCQRLHSFRVPGPARLLYVDGGYSAQSVDSVTAVTVPAQCLLLHTVNGSDAYATGQPNSDGTLSADTAFIQTVSLPSQ